jgi:D-mannonate dehydratase
MAEQRVVQSVESRREPDIKTFQEELKVEGDHLLRTIREVVREGNYRRIIVRNDHGHTLLELPLSIGLVGAMFMPVWAAIGAMAAMATGFSIIVERPVGGDDKKVTHS